MSVTRWDLAPLLKSGEAGVADEMEEAIGELRELADRSPLLAGRGAAGLRALLDTRDDLLEAHEGAFLYCKLRYCEDTSSPEAARLYDKFMEVSAEADLCLAAIDREVAAASGEDWALDAAVLSAHRNVLERARRAAPYLLPEKVECLIRAKDRFGVYGLSRLQNDWLTGKKLVAEVCGELKRLSFNEAFGHRNHPDRDVRRNVLGALGEWAGNSAAVHCTVLRALCQDHLQECQVRGYPDVLTSSALENDMEGETIERMLRAVLSNRTLGQRFCVLKARLLGVPRMGSWDVHVPAVDAGRVYPWEDARALITGAFSPLGRDVRRAVDEMYERGRIDGGVRDGKAAGAFCEDGRSGRSAFIMLSYGGSREDLITLAHEVGHAVHTHFYSRAQRPSNRRVGPCASETAGLMGELLIGDELLRRASDESQELAALCDQADGFVYSVFHSMIKYLFERSLYTVLEEGRHLDAGLVSELYSRARHEVFGEAIEWDHPSAWEWAWGDFFTPRLRFYNYPYIFAQLFVFALYSMYKEEGAFVPKLRSLLSSGSSMAVESMIENMGFRSSEELWRRGFERAGEVLDRIEERLEAGDLVLANLPSHLRRGRGLSSSRLYSPLYDSEP